MNLKIAFRHLFKNKIYASISIIGLALGISCCLLIALNIFHELSYDQYHTKKDRVYRISATLDFNGPVNAALTSLAVGPTVHEEYPEVESYVRFRSLGNVVVTKDDKIFRESRIALTDSTAFDVFDINLLQGDKNSILSKPNSLVLSASLAKKYFGDEDPINQMLKLNNSMALVTGVMSDPPLNTELQYDALGSINIMPAQAQEAMNQDWFRIGFLTYLLFDKPINEQAFEDKMKAFENKYVQPYVAQAGIEASIEYDLTPLSKLHFENTKEYDTPKGNENYLLVFGLLALFILVIASINFVNLSLAQSTKRAKEVGVRKTLGVSRSEIMKQFLSESTLIALLSLLLGLCMVEILLNPFNVLTNKSFAIFDIFQPELILTTLLLVLAIGLGAGSYPAFIMSRFQPVQVLKGNIPKTGGVGALRKGLIAIQFVFSLFMITGTLLINDQMQFLGKMDLGFDKQNIISAQLPSDTIFRKQLPSLVNTLKATNGIKQVAMSYMPNVQTGELMFRIEKEGKLANQTIKFMWIDELFLEVLGVELKDGRNFSKEFATDGQQAFIINETAARRFGWNDEAVGKRMQWGLEGNNAAANDGNVVGVVKDFHFASLHSPLEPLVLLYAANGTNSLSIKLEEGAGPSAVKSIEKAWNDIANGQPFDYAFFDDSLVQNYQNEDRIQRIFNYFSVVSIVLALLGLFALISFSIQSKTKEIGLRKIMGASVWAITWLLVKEFFVVLLIAFVITVPINYYFIQYWLQGFAYTAPLNPFSFINAFLIGLVLSALIALYHTARISRSNPVNALRYE